MIKHSGLRKVFACAGALAWIWNAHAAFRLHLLIVGVFFAALALAQACTALGITNGEDKRAGGRSEGA